MTFIEHADGMENCPTCGSVVCVVQDDEREGTSHYEPVGQSQVERLRSHLQGAVQALNAVQSILARDEPPRISNIRRALEDPEYAARRAAEWGQ